MKLDRNKKYEGLGLTWEWKPELYEWVGINHNTAMVVRDIDDSVIQAWLDAGHIQPVRETKIVRVEDVSFTRFNDKVEMWDFRALSHIPEGIRSKPVTLEFEVEA